MSTEPTKSSVEGIDEQHLVQKANRQDLRFAVIGFVVLVVRDGRPAGAGRWTS